MLRCPCNGILFNKVYDSGSPMTPGTLLSDLELVLPDQRSVKTMIGTRGPYYLGVDVTAGIRADITKNMPALPFKRFQKYLDHKLKFDYFESKFSCYLTYFLPDLDS